MQPLPKDFAQWRSHVQEDPEKAAQHLLESIRSLDDPIRKSIFASLPETESLARSFEQSLEDAECPLSGVPFMLKDLFDFPGYPTTASSFFLPAVRPTPEVESSLSKAFRKQGAAFAGKTHLNEFAYGLSGENLHYGNCPHPIFPDRLSGGSSSGSAWAVRRGIVPIATGTDTGGSIRVPAAWCGLFGIRFEPNQWSTEGCFPLAPSFDTAGWFCNNAADMATAIKALVSTIPSQKSRLRGVSLIDSFGSLEISHRNELLYLAEGLNAQPDRQTSEAYRAATQNVAFHYSVVQSREALEVHQPWLDNHKSLYDPVVWQRIARARNWSAQQIAEANTGQSRVQAFFEQCFHQYDFIVMPATQSPAITAAEHTESFRSELLSLTAPGSFARCPVLTIPIRLKSEESLGLQVLYRDGSSDIPLRILELLETVR